MFDPIEAAATSGATSKSDASTQKLAEDMDQFMNLLVTQLQNQDPLDPMDANEFTSQLVQFAGVEQQIQGNANLEQMVEMQKTTLLGYMVSYIGAGVELDSKELPLIGGTESADGLPLTGGLAAGSYDLEQDAAKTTIVITSSTGKVVYFGDGETTAGRHEFLWEGIDTQGLPVKDGLYEFTVAALDRDGEPVNIAHTVFGIVDSLSMEDGEAIMNVGDGQFRLEDVLSIRKGLKAE